MTTMNLRPLPLATCVAVALLAACADGMARRAAPERGDGGAPSRTVTESVRDWGGRRTSTDATDPMREPRPGPYAGSTTRGAPGASVQPGSGPMAPNATTIPTPRGTTMPLPGGTTMPTPGDPGSPNPPTTTTPSPGSVYGR
jgi:hypothetical protein